MGMGVAGSYLMARLKDTEHDVTGYELKSEEAHDSICAWGTIKPVLTEFCKKTGRNFDDFLMNCCCLVDDRLVTCRWLSDELLLHC